MKQTATSVVTDGVALITLDNPPVNALSASLRQGLQAKLEQAFSDGAVGAILLLCAGRTFIAGADITEFGQPWQSPSLPDLCAMLDDAPKPVIAAIHGTALGGGFELALSCHYRVAARSAKVGLPEVHLGLLPGAGGTQRLPRIVGAEAALEIITSGRQIKAAEALSLGLVDAVVDDAALQDEALAFAPHRGRWRCEAANMRSGRRAPARPGSPGAVHRLCRRKRTPVQGVRRARRHHRGCRGSSDPSIR
jgi:3-hydroxyacyl-CoA dehydrogenase